MPYRDRLQIISDVLIKLYESGGMVKTKLLSYCNLNVTKHQGILDDLEQKGLILKDVYSNNKKIITKYTITQKGIHVYKKIFELYEELFPKKND